MRRSILSLAAIVLALSAGLFFTRESTAAGNQPRADKKEKILVVYYSLHGHTRKVAQSIQKITGGDIAEIVSLENYDRSDVVIVAKKQIKEGYMPKIEKLTVNPRDYDVIFIGSPVWWFTFAPPVKRFLHDNDFKGKRVVPFYTCIDAYGNIFDDFRKSCSGADVAQGLNVFESELDDRASLDRKLRKWITDSIGNKRGK
ncbi:MAG TPA: flavodoxin [Spirochaetota bacterium]|nr:flavodoxin [Spirochaetota bacterium]